MEKKLTELVERLRKALGDALTSVILYGSAAAGNHHGKFSDLNVLCALALLTPAELAASEPVFHWWREQGNPAPLLLTEEEVRHSTDCFPIEFHDMLERRRVLYGKDVIADLVIDTSFYRAQVEHELRSKLLRLRQHAARVLSKKDDLLNLCADSVSTFCVLARHGLLLAGTAAPWPKRELVRVLATAIPIDPLPFDTLLDVREQKKKPQDVDSVGLFGSYLEQIQAIVNFVDRLEK